MRTKSDRCNRQELDQIEGYLELGMEGEALDRIRYTLSKSAISADEFQTCVFALLQSERPDSWRNLIENACRRINKPTDQVRSAMLSFYFSVGDAKKALQFFPRSSTKFFDAWAMMQVCLELDRLNEAKRLARYCSGVLTRTKDRFTKASMADALGAYYLRIGDWKTALDVWKRAPDEPVFQRQRLTGIVKARLLQASQAAKAGLALISRANEELDLSMEIQLPGNMAVLNIDTERDLRELQLGIEALLGKAKS